MWRDSTQCTNLFASTFNSQEQLEKLERFFGLSALIEKSFPISTYTNCIDIARAINLTPYGEKFSSTDKTGKYINAYQDIKWACFAIFFYNDFMVDLDSTDFDILMNGIERLIIDRQILIPNILGRSTYDNFNKDPRSTRINKLEAQSTEDLLSQDEQGICQYGLLVGGPLGIIKSDQRRYLPIVDRLPLWHCADTGCQQVHSVKLSRHMIASRRTRARILEVLRKQDGMESDWDGSLIRLPMADELSGGRSYYDLPMLIADAITGEDLNVVFRSIMRSEIGKKIREILREKKPGSEVGSPEVVSERLSAQAKLQLLLSSKNDAINKHMDRCILDRSLKVPSAETRSSNYRLSTISSFDRRSKISSLGVRSNRDHSMLFLSSSIWSAYAKLGLTGQLAWKCKTGTSTETSGMVTEFLRKFGPKTGVKELILGLQPVAISVCQELNLDIELFKNGDERIVDWLLWKFGFDPPRFSNKYSRFKKSLQVFREDLLRNDMDLSDDRKDSIRASGVNVFVPLENIIEEIISYNVWVLSSDHFGKTDFVFEIGDAISCVGNVLGNDIEIDGRSISWNSLGGNVFGVLLTYGRLAANWMKGLPMQPTEQFERNVEEFPFYAMDSTRPFPFKHTALWADCDKAELRRFAEQFHNVIQKFEQARISEIRNGLEHYRSDESFPQLDAMIACQARLNDALDLANVNRILPKNFWLNEVSVDQFGMSENGLIGDDDSVLKVLGPRDLSGLKDFMFSRPYLIPAGHLLGSLNSDLVFEVKSDSEYTRFWIDFPKRLQKNKIHEDFRTGSADEEGLFTESLPK